MTMTAAQATQENGRSTAMVQGGFWYETKLLVNIALPTTIIQISSYFIYPQTSSIVGTTLGTQELAGLSLGLLTGNISCLAIMIGVLSAADTLMPRAYGRHDYRQVGILSMQAFAVNSVLLVIPIILLLTKMDVIFVLLGQNKIAAELAASWLKVYVIGVPSVLVWRILQRFLAAQHNVWPMVYAGVVACFILHPILLHVFVHFFGFLGSAGAVVTTQTLQVVLVFAYLRLWPASYNPECWPGLSCVKEALQLQDMIDFVRLSLGGVLSMTEWFFWETLCFLAGHMGVIPLCVHSIAYNLVPITFMIPLGLSMGLAVRMGHVIGDNPQKAQMLALGTTMLTIVIAGIVCLCLWWEQDFVVSLFTTDEAVKQGCRKIWHLLCIFITTSFVFGIFGGTFRALGKQWLMGGIIVGNLWFVALPVLIHVCIYRQGGIPAMWHLLPMFYGIMDLCFLIVILFADWRGISDAVRTKKQADLESPTETTKLLPIDNL